MSVADVVIAKGVVVSVAAAAAAAGEELVAVGGDAAAAAVAVDDDDGAVPLRTLQPVGPAARRNFSYNRNY